MNTHNRQTPKLICLSLIKRQLLFVLIQPMQPSQSTSRSWSSTLLKWKDLENKNSSIFLTAEWNCTIITSYWLDCEEYLNVVSNFERISMAFWGSGSRVLFIHYGMAHFVAMDIMIRSTPIFSIFLVKGVYLRWISQNHSNKKGLTIYEFYIGTNMERLYFCYLLLKKTDK
jgi:hypothetical protein